MNSTPNPFASLLQSRKFWIAMTDALGSTIFLLATRFLSPSDTEFVKQIVMIYQPVIIIWIGSISYEDKARLENPPLVSTTEVGTNPKVTTVSTESNPNV